MRPVSSRRRVAQAAGRGVGVEREQDERSRLRRVRRVDARGRADEAVSRLGDHERPSRAHDTNGLAQYRLDMTCVRVRPGELDGARRRLELVQPDDASLGLGHDLVREHHDVPVLDQVTLCH